MASSGTTTAQQPSPSLTPSPSPSPSPTQAATTTQAPFCPNLALFSSECQQKYQGLFRMFNTTCQITFNDTYNFGICVGCKTVTCNGYVPPPDQYQGKLLVGEYQNQNPTREQDFQNLVKAKCTEACNRGNHPYIVTIASATYDSTLGSYALCGCYDTIDSTTIVNPDQFSIFGLSEPTDVGGVPIATQSPSARPTNTIVVPSVSSSPTTSANPFPSTDPSPLQGGGGGGINVLAIALGVSIPVVVIAGVAIGLYFYFQHKPSGGVKSSSVQYRAGRNVHANQRF